MTPSITMCVSHSGLATASGSHTVWASLCAEQGDAHAQQLPDFKLLLLARCRNNNR